MDAMTERAITKAAEFVVSADLYQRSKLDAFDATEHDRNHLADEFAFAMGQNPDHLAKFWKARGVDASDANDPAFVELFLTAAKGTLEIVQAA